MNTIKGLKFCKVAVLLALVLVNACRNSESADAEKIIDFLKLREAGNTPGEIIQIVKKKYKYVFEGELHSVFYREADIDNDKKSEIVLMLGSRGTCGSLGCKIVVLKKIDSDYKEILASTGNDLGISKLSTDLYTTIYIDDGRDLNKFRWSGDRYKVAMDQL